MAGLVAVFIWLVVVVVACALAYQAYDSIRSTLTGTQPKASAPDDHPSSAARIGGLVWGVLAGLLALFGVSWALGLWGHFGH
jgi:hypothetical protein